MADDPTTDSDREDTTQQDVVETLAALSNTTTVTVEETEFAAVTTRSRINRGCLVEEPLGRELEEAEQDPDDDDFQGPGPVRNWMKVTCLMHCWKRPYAHRTINPTKPEEITTEDAALLSTKKQFWQDVRDLKVQEACIKYNAMFSNMPDIVKQVLFFISEEHGLEFNLKEFDEAIKRKITAFRSSKKKTAKGDIPKELTDPWQPVIDKCRLFIKANDWLREALGIAGHVLLGCLAEPAPSKQNEKPSADTRSTAHKKDKVISKGQKKDKAAAEPNTTSHGGTAKAKSGTAIWDAVFGFHTHLCLVRQSYIIILKHIFKSGGVRRGD